MRGSERAGEREEIGDSGRVGGTMNRKEKVKQTMVKKRGREREKERNRLKEKRE